MIKFQFTRNSNTVALIVALLGGLTTICRTSNPVDAQSEIDDANRAFAQFIYSKSDSAYRNVWNDQRASKESRMVAAEKLAYLDWHVKRNYESAKRWIQRAKELDSNRITTTLVAATIEMETGHFQAARTYLASALEKDGTKVEQRNAISQLALNSIAESKHRLSIGKSVDSTQCQNDLDRLVKLTMEYPEDVELAEHQMALALLALDWDSFFKGWKNYFRISNERATPSVLKSAYEELQAIVPRLEKHELPDTQTAKTIVKILGDSRLFGLSATSANLFSLEIQSLSMECQNFVFYSEYLGEIEDITFDYYRSRAQGDRDWNPTAVKLAAADEQLWNRLTWKGKSRKYSNKDLTEVTRLLFGAYRTKGVTNGYRGFYIAHAISDESHRIQQYGYQVETQVVVLDEMASSDYSGWFLNIPTVGGIALKNRYLEFRRSSLKDAIETWYAVSDPIARQRFEKRIERMSEADLARAKSDPHAYLPGLSFKMAFRFVTKIYDGLVEQGFQGAELKMKFLAETEELGYQRTVIHEGRHVLDFELDSTLTSSELEYRAKLSELAFSEYPKAMLRISVFNPSLGINSSHGKAQLRLLKELVKWMKSNTGLITDYEKSKPAVFQLDNLSDENLRQFARSVDPLANIERRAK